MFLYLFLLLILDPANKDEFEVKLMDMPMSEVIYLLTTFANMCSARSAKEKYFIDFVVEEIYEVCVLFKLANLGEGANFLKALDTFGTFNCQRPVFSLGVFQYMHHIINL